MTIHQTACVTHPIDTLEHEHRIILAALDALHHAEREIAGGGPMDEEFWWRGLDFLAEFADRCHHGKEEDLLFVELARLGVPVEHGPIGMMGHEHNEARALRGQMEAALAKRSVEDLRRAARSFIALLRQHIAKENGVLYKIARETLPSEVVVGLAERFETEERGEAMRNRYEMLARELCADTGVDFDAAR